MTALHKELTPAGEATRSAYYALASVENIARMAEFTASSGMEWPISGDQLAALKADTKNREDKA